ACNWRHPRGRAEFDSVLRYWLDRGVDGFRVDVAHGLLKAEGLPAVGYPDQMRLRSRAELPYWDQNDIHEIFRSWRAILDSYPGDRMAVAEAWVSPPTRLSRYVAVDEFHQAFNFDLLTAPWSAAAYREVVDDCLAASATVGATTTWVLSNHDVRRHRTRLAGGRPGVDAVVLPPGAAAAPQVRRRHARLARRSGERAALHRPRRGALRGQPRPPAGPASQGVP